MSNPLTRRTFFKLAAGAAIIGFDPTSRLWVTSAEAAPLHDPMPPIDGVLLTDDASRASAADDYGHIISRTPRAVLKPGSVKDIEKAIKFCRRNNIPVAARGQGHATYGQAQVSDGLVIDMGTLNQIISIQPDRAVVAGGVRWLDLLNATLAQGLTPPVLTDYLELSVGGTLSVGGIGGVSYRYGVQADNVLELTVVTGAGELERCSPTRNRDLFELVLCGQGQLGIIVAATLRLIPAPTQARVFNLLYDNIALFTADQRKLITDGRFGYVEGQVVSKPEGGWRYLLEAAFFYSAPTTPNNAQLLGDLRFTRGTEIIEDKSYFDHLNRLAPTVAFLKSIGVWYLPHPWYDVFVPGSQVNAYVGGIVQNLTLNDTGQGPVLLYPVNTSRFTRPLFRVPNEPVVFLFDILRTAPSKPVAEAMVQANRQLFEQNRALGGTRYAIGAIPFSQADWRQQFGPVWPLLVLAKRRYDPDNILAPGQGIFPR